MGWLTAVGCVFSLLAGFVGAYFTMFKMQSAHCEKQRSECASALAHRVEDYKREFAKREVIDEVIKRIEIRLNDIKASVDYLARKNGYSRSDEGLR